MATYLANPVNMYLLIKRLTTDWKEVEEHMLDNIGKGYILHNILYNL